MARKVFWCSGSGKKSVLAWWEWLEKCFGVAGVARKVFWRGGSGKKSVLVGGSSKKKCVGVAEVTIWVTMSQNIQYRTRI